MTDMLSADNTTCTVLEWNFSTPHFLNVTAKDENVNLTNNTGPLQDFSAPSISKLHFLFMFMDAINVLGCIVVIVLIYKDSKLKDTPGRLLLNQTLADGYVGLSFLLMNIPVFMVTDRNLLQKIKLVHTVLLSTAAAESMHSLTMILFTLHLAICNPIFYKLYCRTRYVVIFVTVSLLFNLLYMCSAFLVEDILDKEAYSLVIWLFLDEHYLICISIYTVLLLLVPLLITIFCYARMSLYARRHQNMEVFVQSRTKTYIQQSKGIMLLSIIYFLTNVPALVFETLTKALGVSDRDDQLMIIKASLIASIYLYIVLKLPLILYGFKSYRRVFLDMCCCKTRRQGNNKALGRHRGQVYSVTDTTSVDQSSSQPKF